MPPDASGAFPAPGSTPAAATAAIRRALADDYALDAQVLPGKLEAIYQRAVEARARTAGRVKAAAASHASSLALPPGISQGLSGGGRSGNDGLGRLSTAFSAPLSESFPRNQSVNEKKAFKITTLGRPNDDPMTIR